MAGKSTNADQHTRDKILDTAWKLYQKRSTSRFTLTELAERLGLHYTALYRHFESRSDLDTEIIERHSTGRSDRLREVRSGPHHGLSKLVRFIHGEMRQPPTNLLSRQYDAFVDPYRSRIRRAFEKNVQELADLIVLGMRDGSIRECRPRVVSAIVLRILNRFANRNETVLAHAELSAAGLIEQVETFIARGIVAPSVDISAFSSGPRAPFTDMPKSGSNLDLMLRKFIEALNERGYEATSIPDVAASIGLSKTSYYRFAASKEELLYLAAHRSVALQMHVRHLSRALGRDALERLLHVTFYTRYLLDHAPGPTMRANTFEFLNEEHHRVAQDIFLVTRLDTIDHLTEGVAEGLFRKLNASAVQPMTTAIMNIPLRPGSDFNHGFMDEVVRFMLYGIAT